MRHSRNHRTPMIDSIDRIGRTFVRRHVGPLTFADGSDEQHVRTGLSGRKVKKTIGSFGQHGRSKGSKRLAELDLLIHCRLHVRAASVAEDTACTQPSWAKLHAALKPTNDFFAGQ